MMTESYSILFVLLVLERCNFNCQYSIKCLVKMDTSYRANESVHIILDRELITSS